jgi:hypothetical protein
MILLWGVRTEGPLAAVEAELKRLEACYYVVDQRRTLETEARLDEGGVLEYLKSGDEELELANVRSCYLRPYDIRDLPAISRAGPGRPEWLRALALDESLLCWAEMTKAVVVNPPSSMLSNGSKPYQLSLIAAAGFAVPETLVTNDVEELQFFYDRHAQVVYKSVSGMRSRITRLSPQILAERRGDLVHCPTQFQEYIAGVDYRVHVVGNEVFSCEIRSDRDDYRFPGDGATTEVISTCLPSEVASLCARLTTTLGLLVSGIDLRRTVEDRWYCFEVNPSPAFTYYQQYTGQPIAAAIAGLLAAA